MTGRERLLESLRNHQPFNLREAEMQARITGFVSAHEDCFERSLLVGHITASAWVVSPDFSRVLLTHHAKLNMWLQMGGHTDGDSNTLASAIREAREESGLHDFVPLLGGEIFDVDAHDIPERKNEPAHVHYDIRYALQADPAVPLVITEESKALEWVPLQEVAQLNTDQSVLRLVEKTALLVRAHAAGTPKR